MYVETFKVFRDLAETGSFSKAALLNSITQSAVSQQIRALEKHYEVLLVERGQRSVCLTLEGNTFLQACREILEVSNQLGDRLRDLRNVVEGGLNIATIYSVGLHELPERLRAFRQKYPEVAVQVEYRRSSQVYAQVLSGEADLGLVAFPAKRAGLRIEIFDEDPMVVICHPRHPLAKEARLELGQIEGERFIAFEPDLPTRKVIDRHLKENGVTVARAMEFDNVETVKRAVEVENGVSIVPQNTVRQEVASGALVAIPLEGTGLSRPLGVISKRNRPRSPAQKEFVCALMGKLTLEP